ncbi:MAG: hypothetical protein KC486_31010 [Myxococcales bacterium]|nr:hypothetical protein [Myxococcales bacterium]
MSPRPRPRLGADALAVALGLGLGTGAIACDPGAAAVENDEVDEVADDPRPSAAGGLADAGEEELGPLTIDRDGIVAYVLDWSWEGAAREDGAWVMVSDLGYTIGVESAYVATALVELVPCELSSAGEGPSAATPTPELDTLGIAGVDPQAAHSGTSDPSAAVAALVEAIHTSPSTIFGAGLASGDAYCGLHILGSPLDAAADDGERLENQSVRIRGWWSAPGDAAREPLDVSVNLPRGSVRALARLGPWPEGDALAGVAAVFSVTRYPAVAFDGVELATLSDAEVAYEVLANLMHSGEVEVALAPAGAT